MQAGDFRAITPATSAVFVPLFPPQPASRQSATAALRAGARTESG